MKEISAKELNVCDIVSHELCGDTTVVIRITGLYDDGEISFEDYSPTSKMTGYSFSVNPIPIEDYMREKNGLDAGNLLSGNGDKYSEDSWLTLSRLDSDINGNITTDWIIEAHINETKVGNAVTIIKDIHYVHEMQQALRLCGLNDIADNFKV